MDVLIIPSAKIISQEFQENFAEIPSVLIPIENKVIIECLYDQYKDLVDKIIVVGYEEYDMIEKYIKFKKMNLLVELIVLDKLNDLGYSINYALNYIHSVYKKVNNLFINFGDTFIDEQILKGQNVIYYSKTQQSKRWTTFEYLYGNIIKIYDKKQREDINSYNAFVGVFEFTDSVKFSEFISESIEKGNRRYDSFYDAILKYNHLYKYSIIYTDDWMDVGHLDKYYETTKEVKARYFNTISINKQKGILTKRSKDRDKLIKEIKWYLKLPLNLQYISPRIFNYSLNYESPYIEMEYYSYNTLHTIFLYGNHSLERWKIIFHSLRATIEEMMRYKLTVSNEEKIEILNDMYIKKTYRRLNELKLHLNFRRFFEKHIIINNKEYKSIEYYINQIPCLLRKFNIYNIKDFQIIHGDLCFTNILYSVSSNTIRLIDPRGEFGKLDIYGDIRYDIAKLSHSIRGKYDFIIEDLFDVEVNDNEINYIIYYTDKHKAIEYMFIKEVIEPNGNKYIIQLIESILFFSMIPLHKDYPKRQYVMLCVAIRLIDSLIKGEDYDS